MSDSSKATDMPPCALGLDIGGTKIAGCVVAPDGEVKAARVSATLPQRGGEAVVTDVLAMAHSLIRASRAVNLEPGAVGISVCELVDRSGNIVSDFTLNWRDSTILEPLAQMLPIVIEADSRAAAVAESRFGAGRGFPSFLYVTIGTGISCSLIIDGVPYRGARGCTGTMATGPLSTLCSECGALSTSYLEQIGSGSAIGKRHEELSCETAKLAAIDVVQAAESGDEMARTVVEQGGVCVGSAIGLLVDVLDPHAVVVGGGLGSSAGLYWETLVKTARRQIWSDMHRDLPIVQASLGVNNAAIGAATLALQCIAEGTVNHRCFSR